MEQLLKNWKKTYKYYIKHEINTLRQNYLERKFKQIPAETLK